MELRSSRSRSRTPMLQTRNGQEVVTERLNHSQEFVVQHSYSTRQQAYKLNSSLSDDVFSPLKQSSDKYVKKSRQKTSDYSSEDGENEITSSRTADTVLTNGNIKRPSDVYKEAGEYWNKYPKTDYTYSVNSKDRIEIAPGLVAMPNMSRRSLRRSAEPTTTYPNTQYSNTLVEHSTSYDNKYYNNNSTHLKPKSLFRNNDNQEKHTLQISTSVSRTIYTFITTQIFRIYTTVLLVLMVISHSCTSSVLWLGRGYYKAVSRLMLLDTWLVHSTTRNRKWATFISAMAFLLLLLTGLHLAQAAGVTFMPTCYPHCGRIASQYLNTFIDTIYGAVYTAT